MSDDLQTQLLKRAVVEHIRWWVASDALQFDKLKTGHRIDPAILRQIATSYYVSRGLSKGKEGEIAELIEGRLPAWPDTLTERAYFVQDLAQEARDAFEEPLTNGLQLSAFSKLLWFLKPEGWALFDKYAQKGLARPNKSLTFMPFYRRLDELNFMAVTDAMSTIIKASELPELWPERIVDKYLMICGQSDYDTFVDNSQNDYLRILDQFAGNSVSPKVEALTENLLKTVKNNALFHIHENPNPRAEA